jgi:hypothetical protein
MQNNFNEQFIKLFEELTKLCKENNVGDPFSYSRGKEIYQSIKMNHKVAATYSGEDAISKEGKKIEYKSTICKKIKATYNGISVFPSWEEQEKYLKEQKISCYEEHYFFRYDENLSGTIVECWKMSGEKVYDILQPKIKKQFYSKKQKNSKDPRIGVTLSTGEIYKYGTKIEM